MPYIRKETRTRRTWRSRLFSWPWRPWQSHAVVIEYKWLDGGDLLSEVLNADKVRIRKPTPAERVASTRTKPFAERKIVTGTTPRRIDEDDLPCSLAAASVPDLSGFGVYTPEPATSSVEPDAPRPRINSTVYSNDLKVEIFNTGGGGDFGGGGASGSWDSGSDASSSSDSSTSSFD